MTLTVRRARGYLLAGLIVLIAGGWWGDYHSCQRSAFWVGYFNRISAAERIAGQQASALAVTDVADPVRRLLDLKAAQADRLLADQLRVRPLRCLRLPVPPIPRSGNL